METHNNGYYTDGFYWGWIPSKSGFGGEYKPFNNDADYNEAFQEAITAS